MIFNKYKKMYELTLKDLLTSQIKIRDLNTELKDYKSKLSSLEIPIKQLSKVLETEELIGIKTIGDLNCAIFLQKDGTNTYTLKAKELKNITKELLGDIVFTIHDMNFKIIKIDDFQVKKENRGIGSLLLDNLFKLGKRYNVAFIKGDLSNRDAVNFDKLSYFYDKNGFEVELNEDKADGTIKKEL